MEKKNIIFIGALLAVLLFVINILLGMDISKNKFESLGGPRFGQKLWTYNMNKYEWRNYKESDDDNSKEEIILQYQGSENENGITSYKLFTGNFQVLKEDVWLCEVSQEFLSDKKLYSYCPRTFEYFEVIFNGVKFMPKKLTIDEISKLFKGYRILKLSDIQKGNFVVEFSKNNNKFIIINDADKDFYRYYIVPNDSKKMEIGEFSNQFSVNSPVDIKIQRLEGCTKTNPCYEINVRE